MAVLISGVHGSAPNTPDLSESSERFISSLFIISDIVSAYEGVQHSMVLLKSFISITCFLVLPLLIGITEAPMYSAPPCAPRPPVKRPYPYATCTTLLLSPPAIVRALATHSAHDSRSLLVYPTTVGFPVVPEDACSLTISLRGAENIPYG